MKKFLTILLLVIIVVGVYMVCLAFLLGIRGRRKSRSVE